MTTVLIQRLISVLMFSLSLPFSHCLTTLSYQRVLSISSSSFRVCSAPSASSAILCFFFYFQCFFDSYVCICALIWMYVHTYVLSDGVYADVHIMVMCTLTYHLCMLLSEFHFWMWIEINHANTSLP